jgi:hypothetical protein
VTGETVLRATLEGLGVRWLRAERRIKSPDPQYDRKKGGATGRSGRPPSTRRSGQRVSWGRVLVEPAGPEPSLHSRSEEGKPPRLVQQSVAKDDPGPKALSCYGLFLPGLERTWLRFVDGRPVSAITTRFVEWCCQKLEAIAKKVSVLIWDNAPRHVKAKRRIALDREARPSS